MNYFVLFDQLEWQAGDGVQAVCSWDTKGWVGKDRNRLWFRTEGERAARTASRRRRRTSCTGARSHGGGTWCRACARTSRPAARARWAAVGVQGLAPYWFEVEATALRRRPGRTHVRFETEYDLLLTNRLVLQPLVELEIYGKADPERGIGAGLSTGEAGLRLRYEFAASSRRTSASCGSASSSARPMRPAPPAIRPGRPGSPWG